jgi:hypothetical protein
MWTRKAISLCSGDRAMKLALKIREISGESMNESGREVQMADHEFFEQVVQQEW